ncbi:putative cyclase [Earliella scabrosa]|nr:putative cyclase [Earliella scabrosa]
MSPTYVDLSHVLDSHTQIYPGDPAFSCCPVQTIPADGMNLQSISMSSHTGTHIDAPYHFFDAGLTVEQIPLNTFIGNVAVVDVVGKGAKSKISWADMSSHAETIRRKALLEHGVFVFLRTGWSKHWGSDEYYHHPYLEPDAAKKLLELGVKVIGVDTLSPDETRLDGSTPDFGVHEVVLGAGAILAENLTNLEAIQTGDWLVHLVPLKLAGSDGSPVRAYACRSGAGTTADMRAQTERQA